MTETETVFTVQDLKSADVSPSGDKNPVPGVTLGFATDSVVSTSVYTSAGTVPRPGGVDIESVASKRDSKAVWIATKDAIVAYDLAKAFRTLIATNQFSGAQ